MTMEPYSGEAMPATQGALIIIGEEKILIVQHDMNFF